MEQEAESKHLSGFQFTCKRTDKRANGLDENLEIKQKARE